MKKKAIIILFIFSIILNILFFYLLIEKGVIFSKQEIVKEEINKNFFSEKIDLKDYSSVEYFISEEGKKIVQNIREFHKVPSLISNTHKDKEVCSGYIWLLSEKLWGDEIPYYIGMMNQITMTPAKAWELPKSYRYLGGDILIDFSEKIDLSNYKTNFWEKINTEDILKYYNLAFSEKSLFGDLGFLYKETKYIKGLLEEGYYNSHIVKNMGITNFSKQIFFDENLDNHNLVIKNLFNSDFLIIKSMEEVISRYKFYVNGKEMTYDLGNYYYLIEGKYLGEKVEFNILDNISYNDITLVHYFENIGRVNGLLEFTLEGKFLPVNIISINSRFIEKM